MAIMFKGPGLPLDQTGVATVLQRMGIGAPELWAVLTVETQGCGFLSDRRPAILYERHIFSRETGHRFDGSHPDISNPNPGGYGVGGAHQYDRLEGALVLDRKAALRSASWGIGQVMGFNAESAGYQDVEAMVAAIMNSENDQLLAMSGEIISNGLHLALQTHNWPVFARGYNGPAYARNKYDTRLAAAYQKMLGLLPDLSLRAAQIYLTYLGYHPGPIDGVPGRKTFSALSEFQQDNGLPINTEVDDKILLFLKEKAIA